MTGPVSPPKALPPPPPTSPQQQPPQPHNATTDCDVSASVPAPEPVHSLLRRIWLHRRVRNHTFYNDLYLYGNIINFGASLAYFVNDFVPLPSTLWVQAFFYIFLAAAFLIDSLLFLFNWHGAAAAEAPSALDISAEYANVGASLVYLVGTIVMACSVNSISSNYVLVPGGFLAAVALSALSQYLFLVEAVLYMASWAVSARDADAELAAAAKPPLRSAGFVTYLAANIANVVPAAIYASCVTANIILFNSLSQSFVRGRGRFFTGVATAGIGTACIVADGLYVLDALLYMAAWWSDVMSDEAAAEAAASVAAKSAATPPDAAAAACSPEFVFAVATGGDNSAAAAAAEPVYNVFCPCRRPARCGCGCRCAHHEPERTPEGTSVASTSA